MKAKSPSRLISADRCQHFTPSGRQCSSLVGDRSSGLCPRHAALTQARNVNFREALTRQAADFQSAQGVNHSLGALYDLLAEGRISPRRASVLAYISSLLLRTLPAIDYEADRNCNNEADNDAEAEGEEETPVEAAAEPAAQPVPPGKEPLPATAQEFASAVLAHKPN